MNQVAFITDIHVGCRNDLPIFLEFQEKFFSEVFFPKIDELGIKTVINLGDTFDRRKFINFNSLYRAKKMFFDPLAEREIWSPTLIGNHDAFHRNTNKVNSMELICNEFHYPNLKIIANDPQVLNINGFDVAMIAWICDENESDCKKLLTTAKTDLCMGHFDINGFVMNVGHVSEHGLDRSVFDRYDMVFSGHFHHRSSDGRIFYLGNPCETTWQDFGDTKGFHLFDFETRKLTFMPNPNHMFHRIIYNDEQLDYPFEDMEQYRNVYVKVVVEKKTDIKMYEIFLDSLYNVNPFSVSIVQNYADVIEIAGEFIPDQSEDTVTLLSKYIDNVTFETDIQSDRLKTMFSEIYQEAMSVSHKMLYRHKDGSYTASSPDGEFSKYLTREEGLKIIAAYDMPVEIKIQLLSETHEGFVIT